MTVTSARDGGQAEVCLFGGAFNPPHLGHLACARLALAELRVQRLALMPLGRPGHKPCSDDPGPEHRLAMCRLLADEVPGAEVWDVELRRPGITYTVDTLRGLRDGGEARRPWLLLGADAALSLPSWKEPREIVALARLAVIPRADVDPDDLTGALATVGVEGSEVRLLEMAGVDVSSSMVRERVGAGEAVDDLVPASVAEYVREHGLYGSRRSVQGAAR